MPGFVEQLGMQTAGNAVGAGMGLLLQKSQDRRQIKQQQKLQDMQIAGQKQMGIFNREQQMQLWNDTNYAAQIEQMKKAKLSPSLIYGQGGAGGTTNAQTGSVSGADAPKGGGEAMAMGLQMGQAAMMAAQIENLKAQTRNIDADTQNKPKTGKLMDLDAELKDIDIVIRSIDETVAGQTQNARIADILQKTEEGMKRLEIARNEAEISDKTKIAEINQKIAEAAGASIENQLKTSNIAKNNEEITRIKQDVVNMIQQNLNEQKRVDIDQQLANFETSFGKQVGGIVGSVLGLIPGLGAKKSTITHKGGATNTTIHKRQ